MSKFERSKPKGQRSFKPRLSFWLANHGGYLWLSMRRLWVHSSAVERFPDTEEDAGSIPAAPTKKAPTKKSI